MNSYTYRPEVLTEYLVGRLTDKASSFTPAVVRVYYGDQTIVPETPAICVEPATLEREFAGMQYRTDNQFSIAVLVYHAALDDSQSLQRVCDALTSDVADFINKIGTPEAMLLGGDNFGGLIVSAMVTSYQYGYTLRNNKLMRANRLVVAAQSKTGLVEV